MEKTLTEETERDTDKHGWEKEGREIKRRKKRSVETEGQTNRWVGREREG